MSASRRPKRKAKKYESLPIGLLAWENKVIFMPVAALFHTSGQNLSWQNSSAISLAGFPNARADIRDSSKRGGVSGMLRGWSSLNWCREVLKKRRAQNQQRGIVVRPSRASSRPRKNLLRPHDTLTGESHPPACCASCRFGPRSIEMSRIGVL